jgi:hypothetical protein
MLDAYIIERIRREREREPVQSPFTPLRIEVPREHPPEAEEESPRERDDDSREDRGSVIIDFSI